MKTHNELMTRGIAIITLLAIINGSPISLLGGAWYDDLTEYTPVWPASGQGWGVTCVHTNEPCTVEWSDCRNAQSFDPPLPSTLWSCVTRSWMTGCECFAVTTTVPEYYLSGIPYCNNLGQTNCDSGGSQWSTDLSSTSFSYIDYDLNHVNGCGNGG
jgi:hypothetical protein